MPRGIPGSGTPHKKPQEKRQVVFPVPSPAPERTITEVQNPPSERIREHLNTYHEELENQKPKRRNAREDKDREAELVSLKSQFSPIGRFLTSLICMRMPNPIPPSEQELQLAEQATDALVEKYAPLLKENGAEFTALLVFGGILLPRAGLEKFFQKKREEPKQTPAMKPEPSLDRTPKESMPSPAVPITPNDLNESSGIAEIL
jgi:hypothetical protein